MPSPIPYFSVIPEKLKDPIEDPHQCTPQETPLVPLNTFLYPHPTLDTLYLWPTKTPTLNLAGEAEAKDSEAAYLEKPFFMASLHFCTILLTILEHMKTKLYQQ